MDVNAEASIPAAAPGVVEEEQQQSEQETSQQPGTEPDLTANTSQPVRSEQQDPPPTTTPTPAEDPTPSQDTPPRVRLTVIDENMEISKMILVMHFALFVY